MDRTLSQNYDVQSMLELFTSELPEDQYIPDIIKHRFSRIISCYILLYNGDKPSRAVLKHYSEKIVTEFPKLGPIVCLLLTINFNLNFYFYFLFKILVRLVSTSQHSRRI